MMSVATVFLLVAWTHPFGSSAILCSGEYGCGETGDDLLDVFGDCTTEEKCQKICSLYTTCNYYTWYEITSSCFLLSTCRDPETSCTSCHTGPPVCSTTTTTTTNQPESCNSPSNPPHGEFTCDSSTKECHLLCDPGYTTSGRSSVSCSRGGLWSHDLREMSCVEAVLLVTGGDGGLRSVELYTSTNSCVTALPLLPDLRQKHSVSYVDGEVLLCGGYYSHLTCLTLDHDNKWSLHSNLTNNRSSHLSGIHKSDLYLVGGGSSLTAEMFNHKDNPNNTWQHAWDISNTLDGCMVTTDANTAIVTGGHHCNKCTYKYNLETGTMTELERMHEGRSSHGCAYYQFDGDGYVLVAGGWDGHNIRSAEVLNLSTGKWRIAGDMTDGRRGLQLAVIEGGKVVATGGRVGTTVPTVEIFNVELEQWGSALGLTQKRGYHAVTVVPRTRFECGE